MNLSGILVLVPPEHTQATITLLHTLPGVQVHHQEAETGRIVVVQEAESTGAEIDGLKRIQALPKVLAAAMVYHYFEHENEFINENPSELDQARTSRSDRVPPFLVQ